MEWAIEVALETGKPVAATMCMGPAGSDNCNFIIYFDLDPFIKVEKLNIGPGQKSSKVYLYIQVIALMEICKD